MSRILPVCYRALLVASLLLLAACGSTPAASDTSVSPVATSAARPLTTQPAAEVSSAPASAAASAELRYYWPTTLPQAMRLVPVESSASDTMFVVNFAAPNTQWNATLTGGSTSRAAQLPTGRTQDVTVRGQQGIAFSTGAGYSLFWQEDGQPYAVLSSLSREDALAFANGLQAVDRQAWLAQLEASQ